MLRRSRDAKQHLALRVAHLNAAILMEVLNQESGHEQLALRLGTLARRIIVGELDAIIVADAVGPDIPVEVITRQGKPSRCTKKLAARSGQSWWASEKWSAQSGALLTSAGLGGLARSRHCFAIARLTAL